MSQEFVGEEGLPAQDAASVLLRWVDSCPESPLHASELKQLCGLLNDAAWRGPLSLAAARCLPALLGGILLGPVDSIQDPAKLLRGALAFFGAWRCSPYAWWLVNASRVGDVGRFLHAAQDRGVPVPAAAQLLLTGMRWFERDAESRALHGSRGKEPLGILEAAGQPGFDAQILRLFGPWLAGRDDGVLKALCVLVRGRPALPPRGRNLDLACALTVCAAAGRRPGHAALYRAAVRHFSYHGSPAALRKLWSRVTRTPQRPHTGAGRAVPQVAEEDFDWWEYRPGLVTGLHEPTGIRKMGKSRGEVMALVAEEIRLTEGGQTPGGKCH